eukprot:COSAG01_NODE_16002_length_1279_cov_1.807627_2_plen_210_part_01
MSVQSAASMTAVNMIGRNEGGLTLTLAAVSSVLDLFGSYFDVGSRYVARPVQRLLPVAQAVLDMAVSDVNKVLMLQHGGAIDGLMKGLLLDPRDPRSAQEGADELQQVCALALQNLALSAPGAAALRSHAMAMEALESLAEQGRNSSTRQSARGALFELQEHSRNAVDEPTDSPEHTEHVMLSYNWEYQTLVKRINVALKARGYTTWIDV